MPKQELEKVPLFKLLIRRLNIPVNRKSKTGSYKAFQKADEWLKEGANIFLFPEGTISKIAPKMREFKNGAFKLAIENQAPIIPITFVNNWKLFQNGNPFKTHGRPGIAKAIIHPAIETKGLTLDDVDFLRDKVQQIIQQGLENVK